MADEIPLATIGSTTIWADPKREAFFFKAGMAIDADGAPTAYHPKGRGLDHLANAGHPGNWYGVVTDTGKRTGTPVIQGASDPAPGFYISPTALQDRRFPRTDPRRYVDSAKVPYISLPGHSSGKLNSRLGNLAVVIAARTRKRSEAIYADVGPARKIGEGSIALARAIGLKSNARRGGVSGDIIYIVFPGSGSGSPISPSLISSLAGSLFDRWGGMARAATYFPELAT